MKLCGWQRLWVLLSVLYAFPVVIFALAEFPSVERTSHRAEFYEKLPKESLAKLVGKGTPQSFVDPDEIGTEAKMLNGHLLPFRKGVTENDMAAVTHQYHDIVEAETSSERLKVVGYALVAWLVPCIAAYALGWGIGWVYRGFRRETPAS